MYIPTLRRVTGNSKGVEAKIFKGKYEVKLEFPDGGGGGGGGGCLKPKKTLGGSSVDIFWNNIFLLDLCKYLHDKFSCSNKGWLMPSVSIILLLAKLAICRYGNCQ